MFNFDPNFNYQPCYFCGRYSDDGGFIKFNGKMVKVCPECDPPADDTSKITIEEDIKCK